MRRSLAPEIDLPISLVLNGLRLRASVANDLSRFSEPDYTGRQTPLKNFRQKKSPDLNPGLCTILRSPERLVDSVVVSL